MQGRIQNNLQIKAGLLQHQISVLAHDRGKSAGIDKVVPELYLYEDIRQ